MKKKAICLLLCAAAAASSAFTLPVSAVQVIVRDYNLDDVINSEDYLLEVRHNIVIQRFTDMQKKIAARIGGIGYYDTPIKYLDIDPIPGDLNWDGMIESEDSLILMRYFSGVEKLDKYRKLTADFSGDGKIDISDAEWILRRSAERDWSDYNKKITPKQEENSKKENNSKKEQNSDQEQKPEQEQNPDQEQIFAEEQPVEQEIIITEPQRPEITVPQRPLLNEIPWEAQRVLELVNEERAKEGIAPLELDITLCSAAKVRSDESVERLEKSHARPDGSSSQSVLEEFGFLASWDYRVYAENITAGSSTPELAVETWMKSEGHRANIMNPNFHKLGVGFTYSEDSEWTYYWSQIFTD